MLAHRLVRLARGGVSAPTSRLLVSGLRHNTARREMATNGGRSGRGQPLGAVIKDLRRRGELEPVGDQDPTPVAASSAPKQQTISLRPPSGPMPRGQRQRLSEHEQQEQAEQQELEAEMKAAGLDVDGNAIDGVAPAADANADADARVGGADGLQIERDAFIEQTLDAQDEQIAERHAERKGRDGPKSRFERDREQERTPGQIAAAEALNKPSELIDFEDQIERGLFALKQNAVDEEEEEGESGLPPITQARLDELDFILEQRLGVGIHAQYGSFEMLWLDACRRAAERAERNAATEKYGPTLATTVVPAPVGNYKSRKAERDALMAKDKEAQKRILTKYADAGVTEEQLRGLEYEWDSEFRRRPLDRYNNLPDDRWKVKLQKKFPNLSWAELQKELKDVDQDVWDPMDPSPPVWPWKTQLSHFRPARTSSVEDQSANMMSKFYTMVDPPWEMHGSRNVNITSGGKVQSFKVMLFAGNGRGFGGYSIGRGETPVEAGESAQKRLLSSMMFVPRAQDYTLFHECVGQFNQVKATFRLRRRGSGNVAPPFGMIVLNGLGINDVSLTISGGLNVYSWMHAIFDGLSQQRSTKSIALARGARLYNEMDYNDLPVPAPDEHEWNRNEERVRDAVIDQVYLNPITFPERLMTAEEKRSFADGSVRPPFRDDPFANPSSVIGNDWRLIAKRDSPYGQRYQQWRANREGHWFRATEASARDTESSIKRARGGK